MLASGDKMKDQANAIMRFVKTFTGCIILYVVCIMWFVMTNQQHVDENPANWWLPAILLYATLNMIVNGSLRYIHASLAKKLKKIKNGVVIPSSVESSSSERRRSSFSVKSLKEAVSTKTVLSRSP